MIIGIDASRANLQHKTGTEWYSFYLIQNLAAIDKENTYCLYLNKPPRPELEAAVKDNPNFSFNLLRWPFYSFWTLGRLTLEMLWRRPDVLFVPAHALPLFGPLKTVNTIHDVAFFREERLYRSIPVKTGLPISRRIINFLVWLLTFGHYKSESLDYLYWSTPFALHHAKKIIAVSDYTKREILDIYPWVKESKVAVVHNGYNTELYPPRPDADKTRKILEKYELEAPYLLYVGRLERKKNTALLVEAFALLRENRPDLKVKLVLIGDAGFGYDEVKYVIQEFNLDGLVIMPGWVEEEDLPYLVSAASAFIFPSKYEGFGIPVLQALACGTPAAISDLPVLHEIIGDEAALYFNQNSKEAVALALERILSDSPLRQKLIARGLERAQEFSWRRCALETKKILENL